MTGLLILACHPAAADEPLRMGDRLEDFDQLVTEVGHAALGVRA
jgi:hypothetical protein